MDELQFPKGLRVTSEIQPLRAVMTHRPGREVDRMIPSMMNDLLFEDILFGEAARAEHAHFKTLLGLVAEQVLEIEDVLAQTLLDGEVRGAFVRDVARLEQLQPDTIERLLELAPRELAEAAFGGLEHQDGRFGWALPPLPNLLFVRDPLVVAQDGAILGSMARKPRRREPLIMEYAYGFHPELHLRDRNKFLFDEFADPVYLHREVLPGLEGGDIAVVSDKVLLVGRSERTSELAIDLLANSLMERSSFETILVVLLPQERALMHLDTVFSLTDYDECLVYPPLFQGDSPQLCPVIKKDLRRGSVHSELKPSLLQALKEEGIDLRPISCGGDNPISQQREQWTDGANAVALAPGNIILYARNLRTLDELARRGYRIVTAEESRDGDKTLFNPRKKTVFLLEGSELSRARGGPHCMSMPLYRD